MTSFQSLDILLIFFTFHLVALINLLWPNDRRTKYFDLSYTYFIAFILLVYTILELQHLQIVGIWQNVFGWYEIIWHPSANELLLKHMVKSVQYLPTREHKIV